MKMAQNLYRVLIHFLFTLLMQMKAFTVIL